MELPIRVMIVLFVAVIVGILVIMFSQQLLNQARTNIGQVGLEELDEGRILEFTSINEQEILRLAEQCVRDYYGTFEELDCYAVFLEEEATMPQNQTGLPSGHSFNTTFNTATNFRITYQPTQARVLVR